MSEEQQRFDELMNKIMKVSPEELKRRLEESKTIKSESNGKSGSIQKENKNGTT
jgi:hypothetical protein